MSANTELVDRYMEGFRRSDRAQILACLTDDIEWVIPGAFNTYGKDAFSAHIIDPGFEPNPEIAITRMIEVDGVVVAEGTVLTRRTDGAVVNLAFCDLFDMSDGKVRRLTSYLMAQK